MLSLEQQNRLREQYRSRNPDWQPATEVYAALVRDSLRPSARVLDLGCGRGGLVEQLNHPLRLVVGVDPDWQSLREHRLSLPRVAATSDALPLAAGCVDVAFASWLLEHLERPSLTFAQLARVLRPGGVFVFITPNRRHPLSGLNRTLGRFARLQRTLVARVYGRAAADAFPTFYRANSPVALRQLAAAHGLELSALHAIPDPTYLAFNQSFFRLMVRLEERLAADRQLHLVGCLRRPE
ncbi:MAG: class I SAM-dependent methyltransferase [Chloroflexi bacterium]|nr:class I SAM-dependent methyltransferase [Chloroflexota bacterium]